MSKLKREIFKAVLATAKNGEWEENNYGDYVHPDPKMEFRYSAYAGDCELKVPKLTLSTFQKYRLKKALGSCSGLQKAAKLLEIDLELDEETEAARRTLANWVK